MDLMRALHKAPSRISLGGFLYINLAIGLLTAIANGSALLLTLSAPQPHFVERKPEMILWVSVGGFIAVCSGYAILRRSALMSALRLQAIVLAGLISAIGIWAVSLVLGGVPEGSRLAWTPGLLSVGAFYSLLLIQRVFEGPESTTNSYRYLFTWLVLPCFVVVDLATFMKIGTGF